MSIRVVSDYSSRDIGQIISLSNIPFYFKEYIKQDINKSFIADKDDVIIYTGPLIAEQYIKQLNNNLNTHDCRQGTIALGHNFYDLSFRDKYPDNINNLDLLFFRDWCEEDLFHTVYSPDMSCFENNYYEKSKIDKKYVIYTNNKYNTNFEIISPILPEGIDYKLYFSRIIREFNRSNYIITDNYWGYLWGTYLNKRVIVILNNTTFLKTPYQPIFANTLEEAVKIAEDGIEGNIYDNSLQYDRVQSQIIASKIDNLINKRLTVAYAINSKNIGDNLTWFAQILLHQDKDYIKKAHIKTKHINIIKPLLKDTKITTLKPTSWQYDRFYNLSVGQVGNWRQKNCEEIASIILGMDFKPNKIDLSKLVKDHVRPIGERYITYSSHGSWDWKSWQYKEDGKTGWQILEEKVKEKYGIRMIDVSLEAGNIPSDIIDGAIVYIFNSEFFIGGPSGLSWVAHYLNKPVILLSGSTRKGTEFETPYDIRGNMDKCNGCYHNCQPFPTTNNCPLDKNYECWQSITPDRVMEDIDKIFNMRGPTC